MLNNNVYVSLLVLVHSFKTVDAEGYFFMKCLIGEMVVFVFIRLTGNNQVELLGYDYGSHITKETEITHMRINVSLSSMNTMRSTTATTTTSSTTSSGSFSGSMSEGKLTNAVNGDPRSHLIINTVEQPLLQLIGQSSFTGTGI